MSGTSAFPMNEQDAASLASAPEPTEAQLTALGRILAELPAADELPCAA